MSKHIEAEGGELLIKSSNGYMAIVPKNMASWVKEHIESGNHSVVDNYVKNLKEVKQNMKAEKGAKIKPPVVKETVVMDKTYVAPPAMPMFGQPKPIAEKMDIVRMAPLIGGMTVLPRLLKKKK